MLRTGQSLLANALIHRHLGRSQSFATPLRAIAHSAGWRVPPAQQDGHPEEEASATALQQRETYAMILSWFLDDPSPLAPFSVHRMALIGKELGKEIGEWFGPSTAAGAIKWVDSMKGKEVTLTRRTLANSFPIADVAVATATDSMVYKSDVVAASKLRPDGWDEYYAPRGSALSPKSSSWGSRAVLILIGIRLGLDGVNPIYHDSLKVNL